MRALTLAVTLALAGSQVVLAQDTEALTLKKLEEVRKMRIDREYRRRVAILPFANTTGKTDAEFTYAWQLRRLFEASNYDVVPQAEVNQAAAGHSASSPWTQEEMRRVSEQLKAETIVTGTLKEYNGHKKFGLPLPQMWVATHAYVTVEGQVYRHSLDQVVWTESMHRHERDTVGGGYETRNRARSRTGSTAVDRLFVNYLRRDDRAVRS